MFKNLIDIIFFLIFPEIGKLKTLQCLNVDSNFLTILPKTIGELKNLKKLQMSNNELQEIGSGVARFLPPFGLI